MKKEFIDGYEIYSENGEIKKIFFEDYIGNRICVNVENSLNVEFLKRRKEAYSEEHKIRKHIDKYVNDIYIVEIKYSNSENTPENIIIDNDGRDRIICEIWKLPSPQNRRVYMNIVEGYSLTEISKMENCSIPAIKYSLEIGLNTLRKKLKKFLN